MRKFILNLLLSLLLFPLALSAETPEEKGLSIALEADKRDTGFGNYIADMRMILRNRHGQENIRQLRIKTMETENDGDKSLFIFDDPKDVEGTVFLVFSYKQGDDDQWLYLPALKRVKRISSRNKSGSFMGSEFSYEDIAGQEVEKYTYKWLNDEFYDGKDCFVIESYPVDRENSGYTKLVNWLDKEEYRLLKVDFYDRKDTLLKTLTFRDYQKYLGRYWRPSEMHMINHQNGKSTLLIWSNYKFKVDLHSRYFNPNNLKRVR